MSITYPLSLPNVSGLRNVTISPRSVVGLSRAKFSGAQKTYEHPGQWWEISGQLATMVRADAEYWISFFMKLNGRRGSFLMGDPNGATPRGSAAVTPGTPLVNGGSQTGNQLTIDGAPNTATGYLKAGDYIQIGTGSSARLHKNLEDVNTNGSGQATLTLWPNLRESPADNAPIILTNTVGVFRLTENAMPWDISLALTYGIAFSAMEVL